MSAERKTKIEERGVRRVACALIFLSFLFFILRFSFAEPTTQRATTQAATTQSAASIRQWLDDLADPEAQVRDAARAALLGLGRDELPALHEAVKQSVPLAASQAGVLHDVVTHVFLMGEPYLSDPTTGFLGVRLAEIEDNQLVAPQTVQFDDGGREQSGVLIRQCMPGFGAYAVLREGDLVISIGEGGAVLTPSQEALVAAVSMLTPGQEVKLRILRQGRPMDVSLRLSARPRAVELQATTEEMLRGRLERAEEYWRSDFASLVSGQVS